MRKIEQQMIAAIHAAKSRTMGNTSVDVNPVNGIVLVRLHGNLIAMLNGDEFKFTLAGWPTPTTRSRVNALLREFARGRHVYQSKGLQWFVSDVAGVSTIGHDQWVTVGVQS